MSCFIFHHIHQDDFVSMGIGFIMSSKSRRLVPCHCAMHNGQRIPHYERVRCHHRQAHAQHSTSEPERKRKAPRIQPPVNDDSSSDGNQIY